MSILDDPPRIALGAGSRQQPLTRFGLIGDVHAEDERLALAVRLAHDEGAEAILCVGDVVDGFGDLDRTTEILERERVHVVSGNHDRWFLHGTMRTLAPAHHRGEHPSAEAAARLWPPVLEVETVRGTLLLCHAVADDDFTFLKEHTHEDEIRENAAWMRLVRAGRHRFMAAGHTHQAMVRILDDITILNPGTLKRDDLPRTSVVDLRAGTMRLFDLADPEAPRLALTLAIP